MRPLLIVLGVVILGLVLAITQPKKDLTPSPSDRAEMRRQEAEKVEANKARQKRLSDAQPGGKAATPQGPFVDTVLTVKGKGDITIQLYQGSAPKTVTQIVGLIKKGYYDGQAFHRVVLKDPKVIQAGDPASRDLTAQDFKDRDDGTGGTKGVGSGGSGKRIAFENNGLLHDAGTIAMARNLDLNSADSQFFVNREPNHGLDGDYCVFGKVTQGMDVVTKVVRGDVIERWVVAPAAAPAGGGKP